MATNSNDWARELAKMQRERDAERNKREKESQKLEYLNAQAASQMLYTSSGNLTSKGINQLYGAISGGSGGGQIGVAGNGGGGMWGGNLSSQTLSSTYGLVGPLTREQMLMLQSAGIRIGRIQQTRSVHTAQDEFYVELVNAVGGMSDAAKADWQEGYDKGFEDGQKANK